MRNRATAAIEEREHAPLTAEEINAFATRIAVLVDRTPCLDALCDSIDELMDRADGKQIQ